MIAYNRQHVVSESPPGDQSGLVMEWLRFLQSLEEMYVALAESQARPYRPAGQTELMERAEAAAQTGERPGDVCGHGMFWPRAAMSGSPGRPAIPSTSYDPHRR